MRTYTPEVEEFKGVGVSASEVVQKAYRGRDLRKEMQEQASAAAEKARAQDDQGARTEAGVRIKREARVYSDTPSKDSAEEPPSDTAAARVVLQAVDPAQKDALVQAALKAEEKKAEKRPAAPGKPTRGEPRGG